MARKPLQPAHRRPVYVNGVWCESLASGAREASKVLKREVKLWEMQRLANGEKRIYGLAVSDVVLPKQHKVQPVRRSETPLLNYPRGQRPVDQGLPQEWR